MSKAGWGLIRDSWRDLPRSRPPAVTDVAAIDRDLHAVTGVVDVHDLHVWEVTSGFPARRWLQRAGVLCVAGMRRFDGLGQVSATSDGPLVTGGVYRVSRNPQYTGYLLLLVGAATARRSGSALALTLGLGAAYRAWIPTEERHLQQTFGIVYDRYRRRAPPLARPQPAALVQERRSCPYQTDPDDADHRRVSVHVSPGFPTGTSTGSGGLSSPFSSTASIRIATQPGPKYRRARLSNQSWTGSPET